MLAFVIFAFVTFALARMTAVDHLWCSHEDALEVDVFPYNYEIEQPVVAESCDADLVQLEIQALRTSKKGQDTTLEAAIQQEKEQAQEQVQPVAELAKKSEPDSSLLCNDCHSDTSTCASSDEDDGEEEVDDVGERELKLMLERVQQIKKITQQSRHKRQTRKKTVAKAATPTAAALRPPKPSLDASYPDVCAPIRLRNTTNTLWHWSVFSGFAVDITPPELGFLGKSIDLTEAEVCNGVLCVLSEEM
ncbi:hypothetical protein FI667_g8838, partial [Globisporangium splendens]